MAALFLRAEDGGQYGCSAFGFSSSLAHSSPSVRFVVE